MDDEATATPNPVPAPTTTGGSDDDLAPRYAANRERVEHESAGAELMRRLRARQEQRAAERPTPTPDAPQQPTAEGTDTGQEKTALDTLFGRVMGAEDQPGGGGVAAAGKDVAEGIVETPGQMVGGFIEGVKNAGQAGMDFYQWFWGDVLGVEDPTGFRRFMESEGAEFAPEFEEQAKELGTDPGEIFFRKAIDTIPETPDPDTVTGGLVRGVSQFLGGFIGAGKITGTAKGMGTTMQILNGMLRGAIADATVFDPYEKNLANLLREHAEMRDPVTEFLAASPEDTKAEARFKKVIEGMGLGMLTDGFVLAVKGIRAARAAKRGVTPDQAARAAAQVDDAARPRVKESAFKVLGDPDGEVAMTRGALDDLDETRAPDYVDADGEGVFINWARLDTSDDIKALMQATAEKARGSIEAAQRGVRTHAQTEAAARRLDAWELLANRRVGQAMNAEESFALRTLWTASSEKLSEVAKLAVESPTPENRFMAEKMMAVHHMIMNEVMGVRTETARALNQWRIPAGGPAEKARQIDNLLADWHGTDNDVTTDLMARIAALADAGMHREVDEMAYRGVFARTSDAVRQVWINSLLSSPHTHMRNIISQTSVIAQQIYERRAAAMLSDISGREMERVADGEAAAMIFGLVEGLKDSLRVSAKGRRILLQTAGDILTSSGTRRGKEAIKQAPEEFGTVYRAAATGQTGYGVGKIEAARVGALSSEAWRTAKNSPVGRALDMIDTASQVPGRMLGIEDELFKTVGYRMEVHARAVRQATQEVHAGKIKKSALKDRIAEIKADPPEDIRLDAMDTALYVTFTNKPAKVPMDVVNALGRVPVLGRIVMPFRRTPVNLGTYTFERTPLAPLIKQWRADVAAGGARRDIALARMYTGTALLLVTADLAMNGVLTGEGPVDFRQRASQRRQGIQPLSVRVATGPGENDYRYFNYRGLEPVATTLGLSANIVDILYNTDYDADDKEIDEMIIAASMAIANQVTSQQYMSGVSDFFDAMSDPQRYGEAWWKRLAGSVVPSGVANLNRTMMDPYMRSAYDMADAIRARTPGLSDDLPLRNDLWGRPIDYRSGLGGVYDFISPIYSSKYDPEPIDKEFDRLGYWPGRISKRVSFDGMTVNMERYPEIRAELEKLAGNELKLPKYGNKGAMDALNDIVQGKGPWGAIYRLKTDGPDGGKATMLRNIITEYRDKARDHILKTNDVIRALYEAERKERRKSPGGFKIE